jgi:hypothetical protein
VISFYVFKLDQYTFASQKNNRQNETATTRALGRWTIKRAKTKQTEHQGHHDGAHGLTQVCVVIVLPVLSPIDLSSHIILTPKYSKKAASSSSICLIFFWSMTGSISLLMCLRKK